MYFFIKFLCTVYYAWVREKYFKNIWEVIIAKYKVIIKTTYEHIHYLDVFNYKTIV